MPVLLDHIPRTGRRAEVEVEVRHHRCQEEEALGLDEGLAVAPLRAAQVEGEVPVLARRPRVHEALAQEQVDCRARRLARPAAVKCKLVDLEANRQIVLLASSFFPATALG